MSVLAVLRRPIGVRAACGEEYASRVDGVGEGWLTVADPRAIALGMAADVGAEFATIWAAEKGTAGCHAGSPTFADPGKDAAALRRIVFHTQLGKRNG
jgi:hypothetical protein